MDNRYKIVIYVSILLIIVFVIYSIKSYKERYNMNIYRNFVRSLNHINKKVRNNNDFSYNKSDQDIINWVIDLLQTYNCNVYIHDRNKIVYGHPKLEFNYSHTMGEYIILSNRDYNLLKRYYEDNNSNVIYTVGITIVHESLHVHQRLNYSKYKELYKRWGYEFVSKIYNFDDILKTKRQNPDADDDNILWFNGGRYYFINCFFDLDNLDAKIVNKYAYPISRSNGYYKYMGEQPIELNVLQGYYNFFGNIHSDYTPNEICAEYNEKLFMKCINENEEFSSPAYEIFKNWYTNNVF